MESKLSTWLNEEIRTRGWSERELARRAELSHTAVNNALTGQFRTRLDTYKGIARAFGMPLDEVLRCAGELPPRARPVEEEEEMIDLFRSLPRVKREAALHMIRGLDAFKSPVGASRGDRIADYTTALPAEDRKSLIARLNRLWDVATEEQLYRLLRSLETAVVEESEETRGK